MTDGVRQGKRISVKMAEVDRLFVMLAGGDFLMQLSLDLGDETKSIGQLRAGRLLT